MSELLKRTTEETFAKRFQQLLKERKEASGLTLRELAKDLDVSLGILSDWQNGKKIPRMDSVIHLAQYFNVTTDYLLGLTDVRTTDSSARVAVEYTGLMEEAINYLHAPFRRAKTQSDVSWAENLHNRMSILIYSGVLEDLAECTRITRKLLRMTERKASFSSRIWRNFQSNTKNSRGL